MPIRVLPSGLAAQIAAGEVVERPASVVKELLENSIDAGASQVTIEIRAGGIESIRVVDDGAGIPSSEVPLAFHRHATSKIATSAELESITTMGFRGEALPSIAAVSHVTLSTRPHEETVGFRMTLEWGEPIESGGEGCAPGTAIEVAQLFGNQPARRKFLRSAQAETSRIQELVSRYSLAFPEIRFRLVHDGRQSLATPGNGQPKEALLAVYGSQVAENMLEVQAVDGESGYAVEGYAAAPNVSRANRTYMTFFVNRRLIQSRMLSFAVEEAYSGLLQTKRYPVAAINIVMPYSEVDVNSHPSKREVRFHQDNRVFSLTQRAVRGALVDGSPVPVYRQEPTDSGDATRGSVIIGPAPNRWGVPGRSFAGGSAPPAQGTSATGSEALTLLGPPAVPLKVVGQLQLTYIVAEGQEGMYLVDQHAAHERVIFDRLLARREEGKPASQSLLSPVSVELTPSHATTLQENSEAVSGYGFDVEPFGERTYLLRAVPSVLAAEEPAKALIDILDMATLEGLTRQKEDVMAASIACHSAIRAGRALTEVEMRALLEQLDETPNPHTCPHGRPTMVHFSSYHVEREFGRR